MGEPHTVKQPQLMKEMFDILKYPPTMQKSILNKMAPRDLFLLYLSSKEGKDLIEVMKLERNNKEIIITIFNCRIRVKISDNKNLSLNDDQRHILYCELGFDDNRKMLENSLKTFEMDGCKFHYCRSFTPWQNDAIFVENQGYDVNRSVNWLKRIFNTELVVLKFSLDFPSEYYGLRGEMEYTEAATKFLQTKCCPFTGNWQELDKSFIDDVLEIQETKTIKFITDEGNRAASFTNYILQKWEQHSPIGLKHVSIGYVNVRRNNSPAQDEMLEGLEHRQFIKNIDRTFTMTTEEFSNRRDEMQREIDNIRTSGRGAIAEMNIEGPFLKFQMRIWN